jgi:hypothetical protein
MSLPDGTDQRRRFRCRAHQLVWKSRRRLRDESPCAPRFFVPTLLAVAATGRRTFVHVVYFVDRHFFRSSTVFARKSNRRDNGQGFSESTQPDSDSDLSRLKATQSDSKRLTDATALDRSPTRRMATPAPTNVSRTPLMLAIAPQPCARSRHAEWHAREPKHQPSTQAAPSLHTKWL